MPICLHKVKPECDFFTLVRMLGVASLHFTVCDVQGSCVSACLRSRRSPTLVSTLGVSCDMGRLGNAVGFG